jgi:hypothetical protein
MGMGDSLSEERISEEVVPAPRAVSRSEQSGGYESVRDSWFDGLPGPTPSVPPALPASVREVPEIRSPMDAAAIDRMLERLAGADYVGALVAAEALLRRLPRDADALDCAEISRNELQKLYTSRLGALERVPTIAMTPRDLAGLRLDVSTGFLLSRIDGLTTLREIAVTPGIAPHHALRVLSELYLEGVITLE